MGYSDVTKGWKLAEPASRRITTSRDVIFDENRMFRDFSNDTLEESPSITTVRSIFPQFKADMPASIEMQPKTPP